MTRNYDHDKLLQACEYTQRHTYECACWHRGRMCPNLFGKVAGYFDAEPAASAITYPATILADGKHLHGYATIYRDGRRPTLSTLPPT